MARHRRDRLHGWLPEGGVAKLREALQPTRDALKALESLPPVEADSFPAQFADAVQQRELDLARAADEAQRAAAKRAKENPLERQVLANILAALRKRGHVVHRMTSGVFDKGAHTIRTGAPGMPDLLVELGTPARPSDRVIWIEVKRPGQHPRENQVRWMERAQVRGQRCGVAHSAAEALALVDAALAREQD